MPIFLNTTGQASLAIGVCDRCNRKFPIGQLLPDPNVPGLRVCAADRDLYDPWRLPAPKPDNIIVRHPRPDVSLTESEPFVMDGTFDMDGDHLMDGFFE